MKISDIKNCTTCAEAIFCPSWGWYKCKLRKINIPDGDSVNMCTFCGLYKKGELSEKCNCETCEERRMQDD